MDFSYLNHVKNILEQVEANELKTMETVVETLTEAILNKKSIFIFGASHAGILTEEMFYRAGGLVVINPIFGSDMMLNTSPIVHTSKMERLPGYGTILLQKEAVKAGDILIVHSVSGRNTVSIDMAIAAKEKGMKVIALTNVKYSKSTTSRHPSGKRLFEVADIVLDNHGDIGDACVQLSGIDQKVAPTSTVIGATILNSIVAQTAENLIAKGLEKPPIFYSANLDGGDELNQKIYEEYKENIHYRYS